MRSAIVRQASAGERMFARFAYAPNDLGYCGPAESAALFELAAEGSSEVDVLRLARGFSGAWPYLCLLAELAGIDDPLDARVVRAYWTGGSVLDRIDGPEFARRLLDTLGGCTSSYWQHLSEDLLAEVQATHGFHVFGIYPWSRLLGAGGQPLRVLDNCRIRWGQVVEVEQQDVVVRCRRLTWDGERLGLARAALERVPYRVRGRGFVADPAPGQWLALHWNWACDRLTEPERAELERRTGWQLRVTNSRLARERQGAA
ncbi:DUF6390 family protein [Jatrophihabitans telluris]|uniref:DUF6390 family protein n=1 Tax=Jatrophihabitans telluris TaxID=2038343 RepID=A0ABY4R260_9ACTN|nr:DUF6390 family protein [Jatrophihabitans telluris]UQX89473.1 DUF6390 family protein [Jatrophihabitans telluris]